jgi:hypothetical protein
MMRTRDGSAPPVVALVLNWNRAEETCLCLADLAACGYPELRVIAIDNGSRDGSAERIRNEHPDVELMALPANLGYCAAMNRGIARARELGADLVLFLNNDTRLPAGFLTPLVEALEADPGAAGAGPKMKLPDGRIWCAGAMVRFGPNVSVLRGHLRKDAGQFEYPVPVDYMPGACCLYRLADLAAAGDLREEYFMYMEDVDLGLRLARAGRRILYVPWSTIVHAASASTGGGISPRRKYMTAVNTVRFLREHGTVSSWAAFVVCDLLAAPLVVVASVLRGRSPEPALAKARGLVRGMLGHRLTPAEVEP